MALDEMNKKVIVGRINSRSVHFAEFAQHIRKPSKYGPVAFKALDDSIHPQSAIPFHSIPAKTHLSE
jgi:hypothetical protein